MVTRTKTNGNRETQSERETYVHQGRSNTPQERMEEEDLDEVDDLEDEFDDDKNQKLEGYDENEYDADDKRKRRDAQAADGDQAAHEEQKESAKPAKTPSRRGFAAMDKEKQRMIASKGGKASHGGGRKPSKNR